jgi:sulfide dehydrogenase cytochrome subunit
MTPLSKKASLAAVCILALPALSAQAAEISTQAAANMANNCFSCHGPDGRSPGTIPSLHTLTAANIDALLKQFRSGERPSTVMGRHAKGYTDEEITALAQYIGSLKK